MDRTEIIRRIKEIWSAMHEAESIFDGNAFLDARVALGTLYMELKYENRNEVWTYNIDTDVVIP